MTVHKAKGLEFDTVIMPYTNRRFITFDSTELIVDPISKKVGWRYTGDREKKNREYKYAEMQNNYYDDMKSRESFAVVQEEMRILYVAMTRTIRNFICLVPNPKNDNTWASHIMEVGVDYE
jgi:ATP-dependent exoDNAse (exonuclease V) beta subunit